MQTEEAVEILKSMRGHYLPEVTTAINTVVEKLDSLKKLSLVLADECDRLARENRDLKEGSERK